MSFPAAMLRCVVGGSLSRAARESPLVSLQKSLLFARGGFFVVCFWQKEGALCRTPLCIVARRESADAIALVGMRRVRWVKNKKSRTLVN